MYHLTLRGATPVTFTVDGTSYDVSSALAEFSSGSPSFEESLAGFTSPDGDNWAIALIQKLFSVLDGRTPTDFLVDVYYGSELTTCVIHCTDRKDFHLNASYVGDTQGSLSDTLSNLSDYNLPGSHQLVEAWRSGRGPSYEFDGADKVFEYQLFGNDQLDETQRSNLFDLGVDYYNPSYNSGKSLDLAGSLHPSVRHLNLTCDWGQSYFDDDDETPPRFSVDGVVSVIGSDAESRISPVILHSPEYSDDYDEGNRVSLESFTNPDGSNWLLDLIEALNPHLTPEFCHNHGDCWGFIVDVYYGQESTSLSISHNNPELYNYFFMTAGPTVGSLSETLQNLVTGTPYFRYQVFQDENFEICFDRTPVPFWPNALDCGEPPRGVVLEAPGPVG